MSGHSKWATTKRQKAVVDAKRGALFTKIGNQIAIAARSGTDPAMNPSLAMVLEKARLANMPKANIERAIARVADKSAAALIEETYEAYGPGGVGIIIEVATDNKNRTMPEVRHTLEKNGGRMADPGSVMFQFTRKGVIFTKSKGDEIMMAALDAGADDVADEEDGTSGAFGEVLELGGALLELGDRARRRLQQVALHRLDGIDDEDVGLCRGRDGKGYAGDHARRVVLQRHVDKVLKFGELDDVVEVLLDELLAIAKQRPVEEDVLSCGELHVETGTKLDERGDGSGDGAGPFAGLENARDDLEHGGLPGAVRPDQSERLATAHLEGDVVERPELSEGKLVAAERDEVLLQGVELL